MTQHVQATSQEQTARCQSVIFAATSAIQHRGERQAASAVLWTEHTGVGCSGGMCRGGRHMLSLFLPVFYAGEKITLPDSLSALPPSSQAIIKTRCLHPSPESKTILLATLYPQESTC